jgi:hypothetical protein
LAFWPTIRKLPAHAVQDLASVTGLAVSASGVGVYVAARRFGWFPFMVERFLDREAEVVDGGAVTARLVVMVAIASSAAMAVGGVGGRG